MFHPYNTRTKDSLHYEIYRSTLGQRSIRYKGSLLRNSLFDELKDIVSTSISVVGKSAVTVSSKIIAAKKIMKKAVFCIDNVNTCCEVDDISSFVTSLSIEVLTCFEVKPRRRRNESETSDRKAFRLCIHEDDRERLLDGSYWPDSVSISDWYFKSTASDEDKRRRIDYVNYVNTASTSNSAAGASTSAGIGVTASSAH